MSVEGVTAERYVTDPALPERVYTTTLPRLSDTLPTALPLLRRCLEEAERDVSLANAGVQLARKRLEGIKAAVAAMEAS
jgi:hypothetical protein